LQLYKIKTNFASLWGITFFGHTKLAEKNSDGAKRCRMCTHLKSLRNGSNNNRLTTHKWVVYVGFFMSYILIK